MTMHATPVVVAAAHRWPWKELRCQKEAPYNNKMQQTRSGHSRWRPSLLILVFGRRPSGVDSPGAHRVGSGQGPHQPGQAWR
jgi:hypothetical protein